MELLQTEVAELPHVGTKVSPESSPRMSRKVVPDTPPRSPVTDVSVMELNQIGRSQNGFSVRENPLENAALHQEPSIGGYFEITPETVVASIEYHYSAPLPEIDEIFPWLHGCSEKNVGQRAFLDPLKRFRDPNSQTVDIGRAVEIMHPDNPVFRAPEKARGLLLIKVGDPNDHLGSLVGSVTPFEVLAHREGDCSDSSSSSYNNYSELIGAFLSLDPDDGINLRNFHLQVTKWALISDIIVYGCSAEDFRDAQRIAKLCALAQRSARRANSHDSTNRYNCFLLSYDEVRDSSVSVIDRIFQLAPHCVSMPSIAYFEQHSGASRVSVLDEWRLKNWGRDFLFHERVEMSMMSTATQLENRVWLGNTLDFENWMDSIYTITNFDMDKSGAKYGGDESALITAALNAHVQSDTKLDELTSQYLDRNWVTFVNCYEGGKLPERTYLLETIASYEKKIASGDNKLEYALLLSLPYGFVEKDKDIVVLVCKLLYLRSLMTFGEKPAGSLIFCADGYTESSVPGLAFLMLTRGISAAQAWLDLHLKYKRCFFCFPQDVVFLNGLEPKLWEESPVLDHVPLASWRHGWFRKMDGSLPSQILPHMYLGSLDHANNSEMLLRLGIKRVLSVGEKPDWGDFPSPEKILYVDNVQDDGVDSLRELLAVCLNFLDEGFRAGEASLVHCRVGVSRSATVCIAEVMRRLGVGLPRAYLFVRVRRLNVIIQPNLRFMYELLKWEEHYRNASDGWLREVDWHIFCREISMLNRFYIN